MSKIDTKESANRPCNRPGKVVIMGSVANGMKLNPFDGNCQHYVL